MRKITGKKIEIEEEEIICDLCKKVIDAPENMHGLEHSGVLNFRFGYFSGRDGDAFQLDACHKCSNEIVEMLEKRWETKFESQ